MYRFTKRWCRECCEVVVMVKCDMAQVCVLWRVFAVCIVIVTRDVCYTYCVMRSCGMLCIDEQNCGAESVTKWW